MKAMEGTLKPVKASMIYLGWNQESKSSEINGRERTKNQTKMKLGRFRMEKYINMMEAKPKLNRMNYVSWIASDFYKLI